MMGTKTNCGIGTLICSTCKKEVNDIRPQIEGVGTCFGCGDKPMTQEAIKKWKEHDKQSEKK